MRLPRSWGTLASVSRNNLTARLPWRKLLAQPSSRSARETAQCCAPASGEPPPPHLLTRCMCWASVQTVHRFPYFAPPRKFLRKSLQWVSVFAPQLPLRHQSPEVQRHIQVSPGAPRLMSPCVALLRLASPFLGFLACLLVCGTRHVAYRRVAYLASLTRSPELEKYFGGSESQVPSLALPCPVLPCLALPCPALSCLVLSCLALPC